MNRKHVVYTSEPLAKEAEEKKGEKQTDQDNLSKGDNTSVEKQNKKTADELTKEDIVNLLEQIVHQTKEKKDNDSSSQ